MFQVPEDALEGDLIGLLQASDPDNTLTAQQTFSFSLDDDCDGLFVIDGDQLRVRRASGQSGLAMKRWILELIPGDRLQFCKLSRVKITPASKLRTLFVTPRPHRMRQRTRMLRSQHTKMNHTCVYIYVHTEMHVHHHDHRWVPTPNMYCAWWGTS